MKSPRRLFCSGLAAFACGVQAGARPLGARELLVATFPSLDKATAIGAASFERLHPGVKVRLTVLPYEDFPTAMVTALAAGANLPDLMAVDREDVGRLADSAGLLDLAQAPFQAERFAGAVAPFALAAARGRDGRLTAFPTDIGPGSLFYRADMLRDVGLQESDLTRSWDDYLRAGVAIKARHQAYLVPEAFDLVEVATRTGLKDGEGVYFDGEGRSLLRSPRFEEALALAQRARRADIDAQVRRWTNEWVQALRGGRVASQMLAAWFGGHLADWIAPQSQGLWRCAPLPAGSYASWGGSYYAIPRGARDPLLSWQLLQHLCLDSAQQLAAFSKMDAFPALRASLQDPAFDVPMPYFGGQRVRQLWRDAATRIPSIDADRNDRMARDVLRAAMDRVLVRGERIQQALADGEARIARRARLKGAA